MKKVWITALEKDQGQVQKLMGTVKQYGLTPDGHFWSDDLKRMAWDGALAPLSAKDTALWIILGGASWQNPSVRQGLSLLAIALQHQKGIGFPILLLPTVEIPAPAELPTPFRGAETASPTAATLGPKIAALANRPASGTTPAYRLNIHALHGIGLWFEVGPGKESLPWEGEMFGVHGADIDVHGVGPANGIPARTVLEYAVKGIKAQVGAEEFIIWAARNRLDETLSYYVRVQGVPDKLLFGPYADSDEAEAHIVALT